MRPEYRYRLRLAILAALGCLVLAVIVIDGINRLGETATCYNEARHNQLVRFRQTRREILGECACTHMLFPACF